MCLGSSVGLITVVVVFFFYGLPSLTGVCYGEKEARWLRCHLLRGYSQVLIMADVSCLLKRGVLPLVREQGPRQVPFFPVCCSLWCLPGHKKHISPGYREAGSTGVLSIFWGVWTSGHHWHHFSCPSGGTLWAVWATTLSPAFSPFEGIMISFPTAKWQLFFFKHRFFPHKLVCFQWKKTYIRILLKKGETWSKRTPQCVLWTLRWKICFRKLQNPQVHFLVPQNCLKSHHAALAVK